MIVVDASVLADALTDDGDVGQAARAALAEDLHWLAPSHLTIEVVSTIRGRFLGGKLTENRAVDAVTGLGELTIETVDPLPLLGRIWQLRSNLTPYDAAYVAAAETQGCRLLTADAKLAKINALHCAIELIAP